MSSNETGYPSSLSEWGQYFKQSSMEYDDPWIGGAMLFVGSLLELADKAPQVGINFVENKLNPTLESASNWIEAQKTAKLINPEKIIEDFIKLQNYLPETEYLPDQKAWMATIGDQRIIWRVNQGEHSPHLTLLIGVPKEGEITKQPDFITTNDYFQNDQFVEYNMRTERRSTRSKYSEIQLLSKRKKISDGGVMNDIDVVSESPDNWLDLITSTLPANILPHLESLHRPASTI